MSTALSRTVILPLSLALAAGAAHAGTFQQQVAADPRGEVDVSNVSGSIVIEGWDQPAVSVKADLPGSTERVIVTGGHGRTRVCIAYDSGGGCDSSPHGWHYSSGDSGSVRLEVHVPRDSELDVSGVSAEITSRGVAGTQQLHTVSGDIDAELGSGDDDVKSVSGEIHLHGSGHDGLLHVSTVSGDLSVTNVAGDLEARTVNGKLTAQLSPARIVRLNTTSGEIELGARLASGGQVETETVSGEQNISVSAPAGYTYEAKSFSGDIKDCFGQQANPAEYGPGSRLEGTRGAGSGRVQIQSLSGDVSLCDH
jgi:DUF4097 and DUF4098 domain-containing protein YvlB